MSAGKVDAKEAPVFAHGGRCDGVIDLDLATPFIKEVRYCDRRVYGVSEDGEVT